MSFNYSQDQDQSRNKQIVQRMLDQAKQQRLQSINDRLNSLNEFTERELIKKNKNESHQYFQNLQSYRIQKQFSKEPTNQKSSCSYDRELLKRQFQSISHIDVQQDVKTINKVQKKRNFSSDEYPQQSTPPENENNKQAIDSDFLFENFEKLYLMKFVETPLSRVGSGQFKKDLHIKFEEAKSTIKIEKKITESESVERKTENTYASKCTKNCNISLPMQFLCISCKLNQLTVKQKQDQLIQKNQVKDFQTFYMPQQINRKPPIIPQKGNSFLGQSQRLKNPSILEKENLPPPEQKSFLMKQIESKSRESSRESERSSKINEKKLNMLSTYQNGQFKFEKSYQQNFADKKSIKLDGISQNSLIQQLQNKSSIQPQLRRLI